MDGDARRGWIGNAVAGETWGNVDMRIIIVEDEGITRQWLKKKIEELGLDFHVTGIFSNGRQALDFLKSQETDVIFTDIRMPVMDGLEFLEQVQKMEIEPYEVILSAYDEFQYARQAMRLGANEFVLKPEITKNGLKQILDDARKWREQKQGGKEQEEESQEEKREKSLLRLIRQGTEKAQDIGEDREHAGNENEHSKADAGTDRQELAQIFYENLETADFSDIVLLDLYFEKMVQREKVMELTGLFLEQKQMKGICFQCGEQEFAVIYHHGKGRSCLTTRLEQAEKLREVLQVHLGSRLNVGISRKKGEETELKELYRQASVARENRIFFGISGCLCYDDMRITMEKQPEELCFNQDLKRIAEYLKQKDYQAARDTVDNFLAKAAEAPYLHPAYVKALCNEMVTAYLQEVRQYTLTDDEKGRIGEIELLLGKTALDLKGLSEMVLCAEKYLNELLRKKSQMYQYSTSIQDAMKYVEEHFNQRISLEQVADSVYLSRAYFSALFRKETGKKFSTYLQEVRLEKSSAMLRDGRMSIQEIADRTGFFDAAHFSRAFKERYGVTPFEYRKTRR